MQDVQISLSWCRGRFPRSGPVGPQRFLQLLQKVIVVPVGGSMVQKLWLSRPQLQFIEHRRLPLRAAETAPHGPPFSVDHRVSPLAVCCLVVDAPVMQVVFHAVVVRQARMVQTLLNSVEVPQSQFPHGCGRPCDPAATLGCDSQVPQTQFIAGVCGHSSSQQWLVRLVAAMWGGLLQYCSIFRPPSNLPLLLSWICLGW